ncbi:MAG: LysR family transcriptional regulator [Rhodospirillales bacterium]|nr:LysR family transcriptional regulator [Rhodospirillales bacterium]
MAMIDLVQLRTFVAVAEEQHLTRAAERLYMSQSAASAHVRAIEERLGTQLFIRTNRNLELTQAGQLVAERARALLREEALFTSFARELKGKIEGKLVVGTSSEPGTRVGEMLAALRARHPMVTVDLTARPSSGTRQGLMSGDLDVGVLLGRPLEPTFSYYELTQVPYRIAGPSAWKAQIQAADWAALARLPWLTPSASSAYSSMLAQMFEERGLELNSVIRFDNSGVGRTALVAGAGMMLLREDHAMQGERDGILTMAPIARVEVALSIAHQSAREHDPLIRAFLEAARVPWPDLRIPEAMSSKKGEPRTELQRG